MAQADFDNWLQYRHEDQDVLLSPPVTHRQMPDWAHYCASGLARPALGLLPHRARYILARDDSIRLEFTGTLAAAANRKPAFDLFEAERQAWEEAPLTAEYMSELSQTFDEDQSPVPHSLDRRRSLLESFERALTAAPSLAQAFTVDLLAPWGLFRLADDEIITVEPDSDKGLIWLDRILSMTIDSPSIFVNSIEWLLRINSVSVIGSRCAIQFEPGSDLALISCCLMQEDVTATAIQSVLDELDARGRNIEATWQALHSAQAPKHQDIAPPTPAWLRG